MRCNENEEKVEKLLSGFALLDEKEQENLMDVLGALLFAKLKMEGSENA